jgi:polyferredoxin
MFDALTLTGGLAWFGLLCIIYFVGDILEELSKRIINKRTSTIKVKGKRCELTDEELMKRINEDNKEA